MVSSSARPHGRSIAGIKGRTEWLEFSYEASAGETADLTGTSRADRPSGRHNSDCDRCPRFRKVGCATRELRRHKRTVLVGMKPERANAREIEGKQALFVLNLPPRKMAGMVSEGMLFDIGYSDRITPVLAIPETPVPDGTRAG